MGYTEMSQNENNYLNGRQSIFKGNKEIKSDRIMMDKLRVRGTSGIIQPMLKYKRRKIKMEGKWGRREVLQHASLSPARTPPSHY